MNKEVISDIIYGLVFVSGFTLSLCIIGGIVEHLIPESVLDRITEAMFGELPDDYEEE